jgi:hypothetical protein
VIQVHYGRHQTDFVSISSGTGAHKLKQNDTILFSVENKFTELDIDSLSFVTFFSNAAIFAGCVSMCVEESTDDMPALRNVALT